MLEITFFNNFLEITLRNFKSFLQKTSSSLALKLSYLVLYGVEFEKTRHVKQRKPFKFGAKIALSRHFWSVSNTKFLAKTKIFKFSTKIALFRLFLIRNKKKTIAAFEISTLDFIINEFSTNTVNSGIGSTKI